LPENTNAYKKHIASVGSDPKSVTGAIILCCC